MSTRRHLFVKCRWPAILVSLIGLMLTSCEPPTVVGATAYGPPGKSQAQLAYDGAQCNNPDNTVFAQCMLRFGDTVRLPDGRILTPSSEATPSAVAPPSRPEPNPPEPAPAGAHLMGNYFGPAYAAEKAHNYVEAMELFQKIANESSDAGQVAMADAHIGGLYETNQDYRQAAYWYQKAVNLNAAFTGAEVHLGFLYANGLGVPRNRAKARELFEAAGPSFSYFLVLLDTNKLPRNWDDITPALVREAFAEKQQREEREEAGLAAWAEAQYARQHPQPSSTSKDPWGSALCNKMLGTSAWNVFSPCN